MVLPALPSRCVGIAPRAGRGSRRLGAGEPQGRAGPGRRLRDPRASSAPRPRRAAPRPGGGRDSAVAAAKGRAEPRGAAPEGSRDFPRRGGGAAPRAAGRQFRRPGMRVSVPCVSPRALHGLSPAGLHTCGAGCSTPQRRGGSGGGGGTQVTGSPAAEPPQRPLSVGPVRAHTQIPPVPPPRPERGRHRAVCHSLTHTWRRTCCCWSESRGGNGECRRIGAPLLWRQAERLLSLETARLQGNLRAPPVPKGVFKRAGEGLGLAGVIGQERMALNLKRQR